MESQPGPAYPVRRPPSIIVEVDDMEGNESLSAQTSPAATCLVSPISPISMSRMKSTQSRKKRQMSTRSETDRSSFDNETVSLLSTDGYTSSLFAPSRQSTFSSSKGDGYRTLSPEDDDVPPVPPLPLAFASKNDPWGEGWNPLNREETQVQQPREEYVIHELRNAYPEIITPVPVHAAEAKLQELDVDSTATTPTSILTRFRSVSTGTATSASKKSLSAHIKPIDTKLGRSTRALTLLAVYLSFLLSAAAVGQVITVAQIITSRLGSNTSPVWLLLSYLLPLGAFALPFSRAQLCISSEWIFRIGVALLALGSLLAGILGHVAQEEAEGKKAMMAAVLCFCRGLQGSGAAAVIVAGYTLFQTYEPTLIKDMVLSAMLPLGLVVGVVMATVLEENQFSWPWSFFCLAAWSCALLVASMFVQNGNAMESVNNGQPSAVSWWKVCDLPGMTLLVSGVIILGTGLGEFTNTARNDIIPPILLAIGVALLVGFIYIKVLVDDPVIPLRSFTVEVVTTLAHGTVLATTFAIWLWSFAQWQVVVLSGSRYLAAGLIAVQGLLLIVATGLSFVLPAQWAAWIRLSGNVFLTIAAIILPTTGNTDLQWVGIGFSLVLAPVGFALAINVRSREGPAFGSQAKHLEPCLYWSVILVAISFGLGAAEAIEVGVRGGDTDLVDAYSASLYFVIGLGVLGIGLALLLLHQFYTHRVRDYRAADRPSSVAS